MSELVKKNYIINSDESYESDQKTTFKVIDVKRDGSYILRFDPTYTSFLTSEAQSAFLYLEKMINKRAQGLTLEKGDVLFINNRTSTHARTSYSPRFDNTDRWLQRVSVFKSKINSSKLIKDSQFIINQ